MLNIDANDKTFSVIKQLLYIGILPLLFYLSAYHVLKQNYPEMPPVMKWIYTFAVLWVALFLYLIIGKRDCLRQFSLKQFVDKNFYKILLFDILIVFNAQSISYFPRWDGVFYYSELVKRCTAFDFSLLGLIDGFRIAHPSHGYFCFLAIGVYLAKNPLVGTMVMQMILYIIAIMCYYGLLCMLFPQVSEKNVFLGTLLFAFGPLIYGIEPIVSCDSGILYYLIIFIYVSLKRYYLLELWVAVLLICSKEQGVLYYTVFYGIVFLVNMIRYYKKNRQFDRNELKRLFCRMIPGFIGIGYYLLSSYSPLTWMIGMQSLAVTPGQNNSEILHGIGININYMIEKLKQIFILNFAWIYWIVFIIGIVYAVYVKRKNNEKLTLSCAGIGLCGIGGVFLAFNLLVVTYACPRYLNVGSLLASIGAFWAINANMISGKYRTKVLCSFIVIALLSSFYSLDPISFLTWKSFKVGNVSRMYQPIYENASMRPADIYTDHTDYNRQNRYFTLLEEKMLRTIQYDGTIPLMEIDINKGQWEEDPWKYDYIYMQLEGLYGRTECYWNQEKGKFSETFSKGAKDLPMNVVYFNSDTILKGEKGYRDVSLPDTAYVLLLPRQDVQGILDVVKTRYEIQETYDVSLHGMSIYVYKVAKLK